MGGSRRRFVTVRTPWFCGLVAGLCLPLLSSLGGCLPDPVINVPDLSPGSLVDGGMMTKMDAPAGDLGTARWSAEGMVPAPATLRAAWVADPGISEAFIVGHGGVVFHRVMNGAWMAETSGVTSNLYAVAARSNAEVFAVGEAGTILRRSGGMWKQEGMELRLNGEVVAVGDLGVVARRQMAGVWTLETTTALAGASLRAVFGEKLDGMYAVGLGQTIAKRVAGVWQRDTLPIEPLGAGNYYAMSGSADGSEAHIAGEYGVILHRAKDGTRWQAEKLLPPMGMTAPLHLFAIYYQDGELLVAGAGGVIERRTASGIWTLEPTGTGGELYGLAGAGLRSVLVVGAQGAVLRRM
jgi:photosystem II stability/assembly factor-like uncharacterized protein